MAMDPSAAPKRRGRPPNKKPVPPPAPYVDDIDLSEVSREGTVFFNVIPLLGPERENSIWPALLPKSGGRPGVEYRLLPVTEVAAAERDLVKPWSGVEGFGSTYTIVGPLGRVDVKLLSHGVPIPGTDRQSNQPRYSVHDSIPVTTGLTYHGFADPKQQVPSPL